MARTGQDGRNGCGELFLFGGRRSPPRKLIHTDSVLYNHKDWLIILTTWSYEIIVLIRYFFHYFVPPKNHSTYHKKPSQTLPNTSQNRLMILSIIFLISLQGFRVTPYMYLIWMWILVTTRELIHYDMSATFCTISSRSMTSRKIVVKAQDISQVMFGCLRRVSQALTIICLSGAHQDHLPGVYPYSPGYVHDCERNIDQNHTKIHITNSSKFISTPMISYAFPLNGRISSYV